MEPCELKTCWHPWNSDFLACLELRVGCMIECFRITGGNTYIKDNYVRIHNPRKKENSCVFGGLHHIWVDQGWNFNKIAKYWKWHNLLIERCILWLNKAHFMITLWDQPPTIWPSSNRKKCYMWPWPIFQGHRGQIRGQIREN